MTDAEGSRGSELFRAEQLERLISASEQRYGSTRTEELRPALTKLADAMVTVALFPLDSENRPAFLFNRKNLQNAHA
jgi:hypothetical protein